MILEAFQNWVIQTGLMVSLLIMVILIIRRPFARAFGANAAYALWSLPLIRLCLPGLSVPQNWVPEFLREAPHQPGTASTFEFAENNLPTLINDSDVFAPDRSLVTEGIQWSLILISVWLTVAVLWFAYQLLQQARFRSRLVAQSSAPTTKLSREIGLAADTVGLRHAPKVLIAPDGAGPLVTGVFKPLVVVPNNFDEIYNAEQRHFALVHEFAHVKRRDLWVALTTLIFRAVNWPNPLVHYAANKLRGDQEAACDAFVVKVTGGETAHSYAETLVKALRQEGEGSRANAHLALSLTQAEAENSKGD